MYQTILFDLDGTLTDSSLGIINSICFALEKMNISIPDRKDLLPFIGPPLKESFSKFFHLSEEDSQQAVTFYRQYFSKIGLFENQLYPDVIPVLSDLRASGKELLLATSKPEIFAVQILEHFQIKDFFQVIAGASLDGHRSEKADVIQYALEMAQISDTRQCLMVGDRKHDIEGAKVHQMDAVGVLYGFGSKKELVEAGATSILDKLADLPSLIETKND